MKLGMFMMAAAPLTLALSAHAAGDGVLFKSPADRVPRGIATFGTADWDPKLGSHRAVVQVTQATDVAVAYLPWRRRDAHPEAKNVLVLDARSGTPVANRVVLTCNQEYGEVAFQPVGGPGEYQLYYLQPVDDDNAFKWPRWAFPITRYVPPQDTASTDWLAKHHLAFDDRRTLPMRPSPVGDAVLPAAWRELPAAALVEFQSRRDVSGEDWNSFYPMEIIATLDERLALEQRCRFRPFILFPENRRNPIRMTETLPFCWATREAAGLDGLSDTALRNEYYVFQVGVYASKCLLPHIAATWTDLKSADGAVIPADAVTCFNLAGVDQWGKPFTKTVHVERGCVQALWFGIGIPDSARPGIYEGTVTVRADDVEPQSVKLRLTIEDKVLADRGDGDHWRLSRLRWLNSRVGVDEDVCAPFTPVQVQDRTVAILGRTVALAPDGLPEQIASQIGMFKVCDAGRAVLAAPVRFEAVRDRAVLSVAPQKLACTHQAPGLARFAAQGRAGGVTQQVETTVEMDGFIGVRITVTAETDTALDTVRLTVPVSAAVARFVMGNGAVKPLTSLCPERRDGGVESFDMTWLGDYDAGVALRLAGDRSSWVNRGTGRYRIERQGDTCALSLETGPTTLPAGVPRIFAFELYATPFKPLPQRHWDWRYYHAAYGAEPDVKRGLAVGAKVFTVHHGSRLHPYISYPFLVAPELRKMADEVHQAGGLFKAYYTIRELSNRAPELWALRSLGTEILEPSPAHVGYEELSQRPLEYQLRDPHNHPLTGQAWMCEHLVSDYHTRWHSVIGGDPGFQDGSLQISGASRWSNFYIEGMRWLMTNAGLDGLYLDGITFDRESFKRVRKALVRQKPEGLIDYHSGPDSIAQLPYFDSIWFGEGADYSRDPDYWLVAVSGIPFGVPGELLQTRASVQRGMVYGICQRYGWMGGVNPGGLWAWWDSFGIKTAEMRGYWMPDCPVRVSDPAVKATAYVLPGKRTAIAVASWAPDAVKVQLDLDWSALGLDPAKAKVTIPAIPDFQAVVPEVDIRALAIEPNKGWILVLAAE